MSVRFTEEQAELRQLVRRFLQSKSSSEQVRALLDSATSVDEEVWRQMAGQLGLQGIAIPERYGGAGYGPVELGIVLEEMGRVLFVGPYLSTVVMAGQALVACDDEEAKSRWLPGIADGSLTATLAIDEGDGSWDITGTATSATQTESGWALTGVKAYVVDGQNVDLVLVVARAGDEIGLFAVEAAVAGVTVHPLESLDLTRALARVELDAAPAVRIGSGDASEFLDRVRDLVVGMLASEQIGGAERCLDMAVDYAKIREQFGRTIGSFQAIKHKLADVLLSVEMGKAAAYHAASALAAGDDAPTAAALAKAWCSDAFNLAAKENIQVHGGIGYTWEHDAHLFLRRAKSLDLLFGRAAQHRARIADLIGV